MNELERTRTLARLYALRAGLSAVSQKKDEVDGVLHIRDVRVEQLEEQKSELHAKIGEYQEDIGEIQSEEAYQNKKPEIVEKEGESQETEELRQAAFSRRWETHVACLEAELAEGRKDLRKYKRGRTVHVLVFFLLIAATALCSYIYSSTLQTNYLIGAIVCGILIVFSPMGLILGILDDVLMWIDTDEIYDCFYMIRPYWLYNACANVSAEKVGIIFTQERLKKARAAFEELKAKRPVLLGQIDKTKQIIAARDGDIDAARRQAVTKADPLLAQSEVMNSALEATFSDLLDPRDWQHVDLIIFYFETGRADGFKEALQQVDREVQTNRIVSAVQSAGALITQTINSGFINLQKSMVQCFSILSEQIALASQQQLAALSGVSQQLGAVSNQLSGVSMQIAGVSSQLGSMRVDFRRALEAKATVPSTQLADDLHYMRLLAENAEVRRRNGMA